jgi:hypothetical protein
MKNQKYKIKNAFGAQKPHPGLVGRALWGGQLDRNSFQAEAVTREPSSERGSVSRSKQRKPESLRACWEKDADGPMFTGVLGDVENGDFEWIKKRIFVIGWNGTDATQGT